MRVLIVGCGYVGVPLGAELVRSGHQVFGVRRTMDGAAELQTAGIQPLAADITKPDDLKALPGPFDWVVNCVSPAQGGLEEYHQVYYNGTRHLLDRLSDAPPKKFVYTSSTSVYGQNDGLPVKETSPADPAAETSIVLVETEKLLLDVARQKNFPAVVLRVAGIYGPGRGHHFLQYLKGEAKIEGAGNRIFNMIHRDDLVTVIIAALKNGRPGEIYNVVDDEPVGQIHFFRWLSETLGRDMPPMVPAEEAAARKRGVTNKKVQNRRLRMELGCQLKYPNFRKGFTAEIQRLDQAGQLDAPAGTQPGGA